VLAPDVDPGARAAPVEPGAPVPSLPRTARAIAGTRGVSVGVTVLAVLAVLYTLYAARELLMPIAFAILLDLFFSPVVRALNRVGIRPPFAAALVILTLIGVVAYGVYELSGPVRQWADRAPETLATARERLSGVLGPIARVTETAEQVERATAEVSGSQAETIVVVKGPSLIARVFGTTQRLAAGVLQVVLLLYFLLAGGDLFLQKLIKVLPNVEDKQAAVIVARKAESSISTFLLTATAMNMAEGIVVGVALWLLGMPNAVLWAVMVTALEFIPYIGAVISTGVLTLAALTVFESVGHALLIPGVYVVTNIVQGNVIAPLLHGQRLTLNPVAIFVGFAFWWFIWGVPGAFISVPLLAAFKILCDHVAPLASVGEFLGQRDARERRATVRDADADTRAASANA
jgi:predicted PurR-regulated permease PerM